MWWSTLTPAVCFVKRKKTPKTDVAAASGSPLFFWFCCFQDRGAVLVRRQPEPELPGEEHPQAGQQQHEGPAHLRQRHADGEFARNASTSIALKSNPAF